MPSIHHDAHTGRYSTTVDGEIAYLDTRLEGERLVITHTWVPEAIGGRGIAAELVRAAFEYARAAGLKVRPACSYAAAWAERHPEFSDVLG
ncbi:GNAT family N-acetyltransferase [Lysobacter silvisoli]|uniref:N-acetyltransferase n=1 Tax=Lysobacter silvisoli TaxID=2293254 RepID=A0A371K336_9GAMM|nr:GNAT family N-acetyltransferase [Lysobacter silvisoli]RDZ28267.1 N-acetyltransferase [Lysobacter silvisoli]